MTQEEILALPKRKFLIWLKNFVGLIPKEKWCTDTYTDENNHHCIIGWIYEEYPGESVSERVRQYTASNLSNIIQANDGKSSYPSIYRLDNPKDRVLKHINLILANKI